MIEPIARKDIQQVRKNNKPVTSDSSGSSGGGVQQKGQPRDQDILSKGKPSSKDRKMVAETATLVTARPAAVIDTTSTSEGDTDQV